MEWYNLVSFVGLFVLIGFAWVISADRNRTNWRVVWWGVGLQLVFGMFVFVVVARLPENLNPFLVMNDVVNAVLDSAQAGAEFCFGDLAKSDKSGFILAFQALPTIIFFSALMSILYFFRIMPWVIKGFARLFTRLMRVSGAESVCAAGNIFVGIESALSIRPHLSTMTRSELCTVLTAGMSTVASNVLALYVIALRGHFSSIAAHLISASILSAPAALAMSKILLPEKQRPETLGLNVEPHYKRESNVFEAVINGANAGVKLIAGIVALLIAVLGLVALVDLFLQWTGGVLRLPPSVEANWSLSGILGYVFYPFALVIGIPVADAGEVASLIGMRAIETEVPAYFALGELIADGVLRHPRSYVIAAYGLCGFAHVASMAIFIGGVSALAPSKTRVLSEVGFRALIAATLACLMTACVAGTFFADNSILLG